MMLDGTMKKVICAMMAIQRYPWEQGVCGQALYEAGLDELWIPMAREAVTRQSSDGRLALACGGEAVSDPAAAGEICLRAWEKTGDPLFKKAAEDMLEYLEQRAPRTGDGVICHNTVSFTEGYTAEQLWIDGSYMVPPFLAVMGRVEEAAEQLRGYVRHLLDPESDLFRHIKDVGSNRFLRDKLWATGNGWALMGLARVAEEAEKRNQTDIARELNELGERVLNSMLQYALPDGRFRDVLNEEDSFVDGTSTMMAVAAACRRMYNGSLEKTGSIRAWAELAVETVSSKVDAYGLVREVAGCPDFVRPGTSAEAQAAWIMAKTWLDRLEKQ